MSFEFGIGIGYSVLATNLIRVFALLFTALIDNARTLFVKMLTPILKIIVF